MCSWKKKVCKILPIHIGVLKKFHPRKRLHLCYAAGCAQGVTLWLSQLIHIDVSQCWGQIINYIHVYKLYTYYKYIHAYMQWAGWLTGFSQMRETFSGGSCVQFTSNVIWMPMVLSSCMNVKKPTVFHIWRLFKLMILRI